MSLKFLLSAAIIGLTSCQTLPETTAPIRLEAETGFKNDALGYFVTEDADFYSGGKVIMLSGRVPVGGSGSVTYDLAPKVPPGIYALTVHYNDENDGHAPIDIWIDDQKVSFTMDADTPSAFADIKNQRSITFENLRVKKASTLKVKGTVHRYQSEHKELVRLDYFEFSPQS